MFNEIGWDEEENVVTTAAAIFSCKEVVHYLLSLQRTMTMTTMGGVAS